MGPRRYDVCEGIDFEVSLHPAYEDTGGYSLLRTKTLAGVPCCTDQHGTKSAGPSRSMEPSEEVIYTQLENTSEKRSPVDQKHLEMTLWNP